MQDNFLLTNHDVHIIAGGSRQERDERIEEQIQMSGIAPYDCIKVSPEERSIGISQVRQFRRDLSISAHTKAGKVGIIRDAHLLTIEAQNALLKILEEPPSNTRIILEAVGTEHILPTILSRTSITILGAQPASKEESEGWLAQWSSLKSMSIGKRLATIDSIATSREEALTWVNLGIGTLEVGLRSNTNQLEASIPNDLRKLLSAHLRLTANVNPKLALDLLVL